MTKVNDTGRMIKESNKRKENRSKSSKRKDNKKNAELKKQIFHKVKVKQERKRQRIKDKNQKLISKK